jgi:Holliday junction DNA helicase RuvA
MYEYISGAVAESTPTYAVIEAGGVGYFINISLKTYSDIEHEKESKLYVHFIVREDQQTLFGFSTKLERELFRQLISVSGVGGNTARMILSTYSPKELQSIIATENAVLLKNVKGLGLKTAQKIIVELSGKMIELGASDMMTPTIKGAAPQNNETYNEALAALAMLGFQKSASEKVLKSIFGDTPDIAVEDAVRAALKRL